MWPTLGVHISLAFRRFCVKSDTSGLSKKYPQSAITMLMLTLMLFTGWKLYLRYDTNAA